MKKICNYVLSIITILLFYTCIDKVSADKINRIYKNENDIVKSFLIQYDTEASKYNLGVLIPEYQVEDGKQYIEIDGDKYELGKYKIGNSATGIFNYHLYLNETDYIVPLETNQALTVTYCVSDFYGGGQFSTGTAEVYIFYDNIQKEGMLDQLPRKIYGECKRLDSNEVKSGDAEKKDSCQTYDAFKDKIEIGWKAYNESKSISNLQDANSNLASLKLLCNTITKYTNYGDNCLTSCLIDLPKWISEKQKEYGIGISNVDPQCGLSDNLQGWIKNILKFGKFIVPVIVIVLGILDFIKAMSADKDDEMKKAQGRFVKRLIAAALIFIIPFIIEFVLDKMGFAANGCEIIDL